MSAKNIIVFDIETKGNREEALALAEPFPLFEPLPPFNPVMVKLGNIKDAAKIEAKIEAERIAYPQKVKEHQETYEREREEYVAKITSKAALSALTGKVVAIGIKTSDKEMILEGDECKILDQFWQLYRSSQLSNLSPEETFVGWNISGFDVPFMIRRSWKLGVLIPPDVFDGRYLNRCFVDLMTMFGCGEYGYKIKLDTVAKYLGVPGKYTGDCTGEMFADKFLSGDKEARVQAEEYLKCDIRVTWAIAEKIFQ